MLEVRLLGKFEVRYNKKPVVISSRPAQSLFAYLILHAGTSHRREKLAGMLWPDSLEQTARDNLRHALWRLRKALESASSTRFLQADDVTIGFKEFPDYWLDATELEKLSNDASADQLMTVLSNYEGELLTGFYDEWVVAEREHLHSIFEHHMARLLSLLQKENRWLEILEWGEHWIKLGQKPEPAYRALMSAHAAKGDMSKVAVTYERCAKSLREFGMEPSAETKMLYTDLKSGKGVSRIHAPEISIPKKEVSSNIPVPLTSFIGREHELRDIGRLLSSSRLVTLTGPGGVGKTRLAIQIARESIEKFKDGVSWVSLVGLSDENLIPQEIAGSLGLHQDSNALLIQTLKTYLRPKDFLLVIDNCEHLIDACAQYVEQLLAICPKLKILATSTESLGIFNETIWRVPSLSLPKAQRSFSPRELEEYASIQLFVERARNVGPGFRLDERDGSFIAQICRQLDGIPLAIELAAARTKVLSLEEIAAHLDDRFSLLTAGSRTATPRHQTLRATINWSYDLLTEPERILLRRLSVFAGGFTLDAAEAVCSDGILKRSEILDLLSRLVDKSFVIVEADYRMGETHYRLLETIRQYALEKLIETGEAPAIRDQHLACYLSLAEKSEQEMFGRDSAIWFNRLDKELDNIRAAMEWSISSGKADMALQIAGSLVYFWFAHGLVGSEWHEKVQQAYSRSEGMQRTLARARALNGIGFMYWTDVYPGDTCPELEEALSIGREFGDPWTVATALRNLGLIENIKGNYVDARVLLEDSLGIWREMGQEGKTGSAWTLIFLGDVALNDDQRESARSLYEEAISILREPGDINFLAYAIRRLAQLLWREGDCDRATNLCQESLRLNQKVRDPRGVMACLAGLGAIAVAKGKFERAATILAAVEAQLTAMGIRLLYVDKMEYDRNIALLRSHLDEETLKKFWDDGTEMFLEEAIAFAWVEEDV